MRDKHDRTDRQSFASSTSLSCVTVLQDLWLAHVMQVCDERFCPQTHFHPLLLQCCAEHTYKLCCTSVSTKEVTLSLLYKARSLANTELVIKQSSTQKHFCHSQALDMSVLHRRLLHLHPMAQCKLGRDFFQKSPMQSFSNVQRKSMADLLLRKAKVAFAQVEQNGLDSFAEPLLDFVGGQARLQPD